MNEGIRAPQVRVIGPEGGNLGVMPTKDAIAKAAEIGLDLIEISPNAQPPVAKITDYGKFKYELKKKEKEVKAKAHVTETKVTQVKIGTSERDMHIKASKAAAWLSGADTNTWNSNSSRSGSSDFLPSFPKATKSPKRYRKVRRVSPSYLSAMRQKSKNNQSNHQ